ncbi:MarR family winged helix-turn-helix transcriptional regulator [Holospora undulata]|uniref:Putative HTH-type transcriptional regulator n=1 Tax=Holospora undulata HU1 TaxID=1321371 RepID=A0A061JGV6_9PROT|nr:MarR family winged helix-turn-helix transcriptional regulator [Holospora undulata]ETZ04423.1 putative HTH-type transcriptional regulator [Holospora undulata HU1]
MDTDISRDKEVGVKSLLGYKLKKTQHALRLHMDEALRTINLTTPQYAVLAQLELKPGTSNATLERSAFITAKTMHGIVSNLEKRGLIQRKNDVSHGKILCTELTDQDHKVVIQAHDMIRAFTNAVKQEAIDVIEMSLSPGDFYVLTHGNICPDNVFDHEDKDKLQLIDFEWVRPGSSLLDATYFRMNFPTCWCAKALPEEVILELEGLYRQTIASKIKASLDDAKYNESYAAACGFWLLSSMPFALRIMDKDECWPSSPVPVDSLWKQEANLARPRFISRLQAFIQVSKAYNLLHHLRKSAEQTLAKAYEKWDDAKPLDLYPAFQN